jgi:hypothetical protein
MEENINRDSIERKFQESFAGYESPPPGRIWPQLKEQLHPEPRFDGLWSWISRLPESSPRFFRLSIGTVAAVVVLFLTLVWFASVERYSLRGHAYSGEVRLCKGTAYLFAIKDKTKPYDSLQNIRSSDIDENGFYQFSQLEPGRYLVRISPLENTEGHKKFHPSWYDQQIKPDSAHLILIKTEDLTVDVHLLPRMP